VGISNVTDQGPIRIAKLDRPGLAEFCEVEEFYLGFWKGFNHKQVVRELPPACYGEQTLCERTRRTRFAEVDW